MDIIETNKTIVATTVFFAACLFASIGIPALAGDSSLGIASIEKFLSGQAAPEEANKAADKVQEHLLKSVSILDNNAQLFIEEGQLPHAINNNILAELGCLEYKMIGHEGCFRATLV